MEPGPDSDCVSHDSAKARELQRRASLWLHQEGFQTECLDDGNVVFRCEGVKFYLGLYPDDPQYFQFMCAGIWKIESEAERQRALALASRVSRETKVAKVYLTADGNSVFSSAELVLPTDEGFPTLVGRAVSTLLAAARKFREEMLAGSVDKEQGH